MKEIDLNLKSKAVRMRVSCLPGLKNRNTEYFCVGLLANEDKGNNWSPNWHFRYTVKFGYIFRQ